MSENEKKVAPETTFTQTLSTEELARLNDRGFLSGGRRVKVFAKDTRLKDLGLIEKWKAPRVMGSTEPFSGVNDGVVVDVCRTPAIGPLGGARLNNEVYDNPSSYPTTQVERYVDLVALFWAAKAAGNDVWYAEDPKARTMYVMNATAKTQYYTTITDLINRDVVLGDAIKTSEGRAALFGQAECFVQSNLTELLNLLTEPGSLFLKPGEVEALDEQNRAMKAVDEVEAHEDRTLPKRDLSKPLVTSSLVSEMVVEMDKAHLDALEKATTKAD